MNFRKIFRSFIVLCLAAVLVALSLPTVLAAETSGTCGKKVKWSLSDGNLNVSGKGDMEDYYESAPAPWYELREKIRTVTVSRGVTGIGSSAFWRCTRLSAVTLSDSVKKISDMAFAECEKLAQISMNGVSFIGVSAFESCKSLTAVRLSDKLIHIGDRAFYRCSSLGGVKIPKSAVELGKNAFSYCTDMLSATVEAPIKELPYWFFYGSTALAKLQLPDTLQEIQTNALSKCDALNSVSFEGSDEVWKQINAQLMDISGTSENNGKTAAFTETEYASVITETIVHGELDSDGNAVPDTYTVKATLTGKKGWKDVVDAVLNIEADNAAVEVIIQLVYDNVIPGGALSDLAGKDAAVKIFTAQNDGWSFNMKLADKSVLRKKQKLAVSVEETEHKEVPKKYREIVYDADCYEIKLKNSSLDANVLIPLDASEALRTATLYKISKGRPQILQSVVVDDDGRASFWLKGSKSGTYLLALDVNGVSKDSVMIPEALYDKYGINKNYTLTDKDGNLYAVTDPVSNLPFTLTQLLLGVFGAMVLVGAVVSVIMLAAKKKISFPSAKEKTASDKKSKKN